MSSGKMQVDRFFFVAMIMRMDTTAHIIRLADKIEKLHEDLDLAVQERDHYAVRLHREGASLAKVASLARVTRGRIWQIVERDRGEPA